MECTEKHHACPCDANYVMTFIMNESDNEDVSISELISIFIVCLSYCI